MLHFLSDSEAGSSRATGIRCGPVAETEALSRLAVGCGPQKLYNAPIQALRSMTVVPQVCDPVVDAESRSSLQPAADHI